MSDFFFRIKKWNFIYLLQIIPTKSENKPLIQKNIFCQKNKNQNGLSSSIQMQMEAE